jgi:hypothetical protein
MTTNDIDYNIDYEPNYNLFLDDSAFEENETEEEKENIRTALYQKDLLAVFNMDEFDEDVINKKIRELFLLIQENEDLFLCMNNISKKTIFSNEEIGLMIMYSFEYMYLSHFCISEYIKTGSISETNLNNLKKAIEIE